RVNLCVGAGYAMASGLQQPRQRSHRRSADTDQVVVPGRVSCYHFAIRSFFRSGRRVTRQDSPTPHRSSRAHTATGAPMLRYSLTATALLVVGLTACLDDGPVAPQCLDLTGEITADGDTMVVSSGLRFLETAEGTGAAAESCAG